MRSRCGAPRLSNAMSWKSRPSDRAASRDRASEPLWVLPLRLISVRSPRRRIIRRRRGGVGWLQRYTLPGNDGRQVAPDQAKDRMVDEQRVDPGHGAASGSAEVAVEDGIHTIAGRTFRQGAHMVTPRRPGQPPAAGSADHADRTRGRHAAWCGRRKSAPQSRWFVYRWLIPAGGPAFRSGGSPVGRARSTRSRGAPIRPPLHTRMTFLRSIGRSGNLVPRCQV